MKNSNKRGQSSFPGERQEHHPMFFFCSSRMSKRPEPALWLSLSAYLTGQEFLVYTLVTVRIILCSTAAGPLAIFYGWTLGEHEFPRRHMAGGGGPERTSLAPGQLQLQNRPASNLRPGPLGAMSSRDREDPGDSAGRARRGFVFLEALFQGSICVIWCLRRAPDSNYPHSLTCKMPPWYCERDRATWSQVSSSIYHFSMFGNII